MIYHVCNWLYHKRANEAAPVWAFCHSSWTSMQCAACASLQDYYIITLFANQSIFPKICEKKKILPFFCFPIDFLPKSCIINNTVVSKVCESGGTGRRARLRGVWYTPYGFKSRFSHQKPLHSSGFYQHRQGRLFCHGDFTSGENAE